MKIIILAGGSGTRLWPMSRRKRAKQFNAITNSKTMLEVTLERFLGFYDLSDIYISTTPQCLPNIKKILPAFSEENIIIEPEQRDTAAAMGYVSGLLSLKFPDEPIAFIPSDHYIQNVEKFLEIIKTAEEKIKKTGKLLDIGAVPTYPSTALGYIEIGEKIKDKGEEGIDIYNFVSHTEKPGYEIAKKYVKSGKYLWHCNFYMWTPRLFLEAFKKYVPETHSLLQKIIKLVKNKATLEKITELYLKMPKIMIDYAITEKMDSHDVLIIKGDFGWSDIGGWDILDDKLTINKDEKGNLIKGEWMGIDTSHTLVFSPPHKIVTTIGVDDMVIIDTPDALLVCPKGRSQDVKKIVELMKKDKDKKKYL